MLDRHALSALALVAAAAAAPAHATDFALAANGAWQPFSVDSLIANSFGTEWIDDSNGSALIFTFTIGAGSIGSLTVVDGGFAGDTFKITNFAGVIGATSAVAPVVYDFNAPPPSSLDFDANLASPYYSHGLFTLGAGTYRIGGYLDQSVLFSDGSRLDATAGAVRLTVSSVPEPSVYAMLLSCLGVMGWLVRRQR